MPGETGTRVARERDPVDVHIGRRIRKRRLMLGMTQMMLAERLGVSFQAVQKWENGIVRITIALLLRIARTLDVPPGYFLRGFAVDKDPGVKLDDGQSARAEDWLTLRVVRPLMALPPEVRDEVIGLIRGLVRALEKE
jgi:transcriptional regulator with XRE-family HTH domain